MAATIIRGLQGGRLFFEIDLKSKRNGRWYIIVLAGAALRGDPLATLTLDTRLPEGVSTRRFVRLRFGGRTVVQYFLFAVQDEEQSVAIEVYRQHAGESLRVRLIAVPKLLAALMLICLQPSILLPLNAGKAMRAHGGFRKRLAFAALKLGPRLSYAMWLRWYDRWDAKAGNIFPGKVMALVFSSGDQDRVALDATLAALSVASGSAPEAALPVVVIDAMAGNPDAALKTRLDATVADFIIVLQAGEVIAPHAIAALVRFAQMRQLKIVYADEDRVDFAGNRSAPIFKPEPNRMLMLSGTLATGVFLFRRDALGSPGDGSAACADALRLTAWLALHARQGDAGFSARLPFILTHRRHDTAATSPELLATIARADLGSAWIGEIDAARLPLRIRPGIGGPAQKVSLIVASTARLAHVQGCLRAVLEKTVYPNFEMIIVLSQSGPPDAVQQNILAPIVADARVRVILAPMEQFNYSTANNAGATQSTAPLICLLNDDVAPITPDWLTIMVGHLQDERIGAVGAKLYYPEATVQHGGVIMGLGGLCDHAFRFLGRSDMGYAGRAAIEQELSAVTGACMLIRKPVFEAVGGLDEHFAANYNDVDLCLKIRTAGYGIIWSARAELWHQETISFDHHDADAHKPLADRDIGIMRERWMRWCAADPFHNPNLSLEVQSEWELAFPPRLGDLPEALGLMPCDD